LRDLFSYRFDRGSLAGHNVGNIILAALEKQIGNPEEAIKLVAKMLNVRGQVVPITLFPTKLTAILQNGKKIIGEHNIDDAKTDRPSIKELKLTPSGPANPRALRLIESADVIVFGPGDLFTSTMPNLLVRGVKEAIAKSKAKKVMIANIMTKRGQTDKFAVSDCVRVLQKHLGKKLDTVIVNTARPPTNILKLYKKEKADLMNADIPAIEKLGAKVMAASLLSDKPAEKIPGDIIKRSLLRHDSEKLAKIIYKLVS